MDLKANLHLTLKLEMLKVNAKDKALDRIELIRVYMHVKFERDIFSSFPTIDLNAVAKPNR